MHVSNKCSIAIHCLIFIHEYGTENKVTSELLSLSTGCNPVTIRGILVDFRSRFPGGRGAVRELAELILRAQDRWDDLIRQTYVEGK